LIEAMASAFQLFRQLSVVLWPHIRDSRAESVLRSDASHRNVHRFAGEEFFRAIEQASQIEAALLELVDFARGSVLGEVAGGCWAARLLPPTKLE